MRAHNRRMINTPEQTVLRFVPECFCICERKGSEIQKDRKKQQKLFKNRLTNPGIHDIMNELANRDAQATQTTASTEP